MADDDERGSGGPSGSAGRDRAILAAWIAGGAAVVAALVGAVATIVAPLVAASGGDDGGSAGGQTASPPAVRTAEPDRTAASAVPSGATGAAGAGGAAGAVWWSGTLVVGPLDAGDKDLDVRPPAHAAVASENDVYITVSAPATLYAPGSADVAAWRDPGRLPGAADCANAVESAADGVPLAQGATVCARTGDGRVARLTVTAMPGGGSTTATFDAVVWQTA